MFDDYVTKIQSDEIENWSEEDYDPAFFWDEDDGSWDW